LFKLVLPYLAVFTGVFLEGETALFTSAYLAKTGNLNIFLVSIVAFLSTLISDWLWFFIGRIKGRSFIQKRKKLFEMNSKMDKIIQKYPVVILLFYRYIYGMRTVIPLFIGLSNIKTYKFITFSLITITFWTVLVSFIGYTFGIIVLSVFEKIKNYQIIIITILILLGLAIGVFINYYTKKKLRSIQ